MSNNTNMEDKTEELINLSQDVIKLSRNTLLVYLRYLDMALSRLTPVAVEDIEGIATDGQYIAYNPVDVLRRYKRAREIPVRDYLHIVMHCIFRHMYIHSLVDRECWDLACDIAVESAISDLKLKSVEAPRQAEQQRDIERIQKRVKYLTAERIYRYFLDYRPSDNEMARMKELFSADDHFFWYLPPEEKMDNTRSLSKKAGNSDQFGKDDNDSNDSSSSQQSSSNMMSSIEAEEDWENISRRMQEDLETFSKQQGDHADNLMQNIAEVNREKYDYSSFLKKFAVLGEVMKINDDEFDYVYYTYGLKLYDKMPLIEPLEYKETKRIREFVIAIDTSGSTSGETVQKFLQKTYNIFQQSESFFTKINVRIIQCDAEIQDDTKITSREEFDQYLKTMQIHGQGGTDFRPVFTYVDNLIAKREFTNLKGMIYFTDGCGEFPAHKPDYETAFVFVYDNEYNNYDIPPWAIKLILHTDEV